MKSGIYNIINTTNGKRYVGLTKNLEVRWRTHVNKLREGKHRNAHLQYAWNTYGESSFCFEILERCEESKLFDREHYWATFYDTHNHEKGYNIRPTDAEGRIIQSEETKAKIGLTSRRPCSEETRRKISEGNKRAMARFEAEGKVWGRERKTPEQQKETARLAQQKWFAANPEARERKNAKRRKGNNIKTINNES